jgi:hypothetical protein
VGLVILGEDGLRDRPVTVVPLGCPSGLLSIKTLTIGIHKATRSRRKPGNIEQMHENREPKALTSSWTSTSLSPGPRACSSQGWQRRRMLG